FIDINNSFSELILFVTQENRINNIPKIEIVFFTVFVIISANGLQLQEVGDFGDENCLPPLNLIQSTKLHLATEPPISCSCCYLPFFYFCLTVYSNLSYSNSLPFVSLKISMKSFVSF